MLIAVLNSQGSEVILVAQYSSYLISPPDRALNPFFDPVRPALGACTGLAPFDAPRPFKEVDRSMQLTVTGARHRCIQPLEERNPDLVVCRIRKRAPWLISV